MVKWDEFQEIVWNNAGEKGIVDREMITLDTKLLEDLQYDSVGIMDLLSDIEEKWGVDFTDLEDFGDRFNVCGEIFEGIKILLEEGRKTEQ